MKFLEQAYEDERAVDFRIEIHRKATVDRALAFEEIAPPKDMKAAMENTFKNIVAARDNADDKWICRFSNAYFFQRRCVLWWSA